MGADAGRARPADEDADLLVNILEEVIFRMETRGELPLRTEVRDDGADGLHVRWQTTDADTVELTGAVPKAISLHELRFGPDGPRWSCTLTVDV